MTVQQFNVKMKMHTELSRSSVIAKLKTFFVQGLGVNFGYQQQIPIAEKQCLIFNTKHGDFIRIDFTETKFVCVCSCLNLHILSKSDKSSHTEK